MMTSQQLKGKHPHSKTSIYQIYVKVNLFCVNYNNTYILSLLHTYQHMFTDHNALFYNFQIACAVVFFKYVC